MRGGDPGRVGWRLKVENEWETENDGGKLREGKSGFSCCNTTFLGLARLSKGKDVPPEQDGRECAYCRADDAGGGAHIFTLHCKVCARLSVRP